MSKTDKKLIILGTVLVLALFVISACQQTVGVPRKNIIDGNNGNITNQTGSFYAFSNPSSANFYVDNLFKGLTPIRVDGLNVGSHIIELRKVNYTYYQDVKRVYANQVTYINVTLTPLGNNQTNSSTYTQGAYSY